MDRAINAFKAVRQVHHVSQAIYFLFLMGKKKNSGRNKYLNESIEIQFLIKSEFKRTLIELNMLIELFRDFKAFHYWIEFDVSF